jgi:hypothetical protein
MSENVLTREQVYSIIDSERDYQEEMKKLCFWQETHSVGDFLTMIRHYSAKADAAWNEHTGEEIASDFIRKIAGIAVACMEQNGAPRRTTKPVARF